MSIRQEPCGRWRVRYEYNVLEDSEEEALATWRMIRAAVDRIRAERKAGLSDCPTVSDLAPRFLRDPMSTYGTSKSTKQRTARALRYVVEILDDPRLDEIGPAAISEYVETRLRSASAKVIDREIGVLKRLGTWAANRSLCVSDLDIFKAESVSRKRGANKRSARILEPSELAEAVFSLTRGGFPHVAAVLRGMVLFGARPAALFKMRVSDVTLFGLREGVVSIPGVKGGDRVEVPMPRGSRRAELVWDLEEVWTDVRGRSRVVRSPAKPLFPSRRFKSAENRYGWTSSSYAAALKSALEECGAPSFRAYDVRHSAVTWLARSGAPEVVIQHYAKHLSVGTQRVYRHTTGQVAAPAYDHVETILDGVNTPVFAPYLGSGKYNATPKGTSPWGGL